MYEDDEFRIPDRGPWNTRVSRDSRELIIDSDDGEHDAMLTLQINGDFGTPERRARYAKFICKLLNDGSKRERALQELVDKGGLLAVLERVAKDSPDGPLLELALNEISRLLGELTDAQKILQQVEVGRHVRNRVAKAAEPSDFAQKLAQAFGRQLT